MKISIGQFVVGENFFDRKRELARLKETYLDKRGNAFIPGPRRLGKTSLAKEFIRLNKDNYRFVYFDLESRYSIIDLCKDLMDEIQRQFPGFVKTKGKLLKLWNTVSEMISQFGAGGLITVKTGKIEKSTKDFIEQMEQILIELHRHDFIFAFDEFSDFLLNLKKHYGIDEVKFFLEWLRRLRQEEKIRVLITGSVNIMSTVEELDFPHLINDMTDIKIFPLPPDDVRILLIELLKDKRITFSGDALDFAIEKLSDGIPFYIQLFAEGVFLHGGESRKVETLEEARSIYQEITGAQHTEFIHFHSRLKKYLSGPVMKAAKKILAHCSQKPMSFDDLYALVKEFITDKEAFNKLLKRLADECYLKKSEEKYSFISPMLADWWKGHYEWEG